MYYRVLNDLKIPLFNCFTEAVQLLSKKKRQLSSESYRFDYVNLSLDTCPGIFLSPIAQVTKHYPGYNVIAPRLALYKPGDFADQHVDDYEGCLTVSVLLWEHGESSLYVNNEKVPLKIGEAVVFNAKVPHEVKAIDFFNSRLVLVFWLKKEVAD